VTRLSATEVHAARRRLSQIEMAIATRAFTFSTEAELQAGIRGVLERDPLTEGLERFNEVAIDAESRIDFLVRGIGIECKVAGSVATIAPQLLRYLESPSVHALLLVTTKRAHARLEGEPLGKRLRVLVLTGGAF
jgi:hypothetical protein